jgi:hypothetical protein
VFEYSADNQQLFSPGGETFEAFAAVPEPSGTGDGVAWLVHENGTEQFVLQTEHGPVQVRTAAELLSALEHVGPPAACPHEKSSEVRVSLIA